jgi:hypothetical protein
MAKKWHEVNNPKDNVEYWVVVDCINAMPHYFKTKEEALAFQEYSNFEDSVVFQECFN